MFDSNYLIVTIPDSGKSMVIRTIEDEDSPILYIGALRANASLISINDSFEESLQVVKNLS